MEIQELIKCCSEQALIKINSICYKNRNIGYNAYKDCFYSLVYSYIIAYNLKFTFREIYEEFLIYRVDNDIIKKLNCEA